MDAINSEELCEINEANVNFIRSVLKLSSKLSVDVTRPLFEKSSKNGSGVSVETQATSSPLVPLPDVCSRCYTAQHPFMMHTQLQPCYRSARSVRYITAKKCSVLHKLSSREKMMIDSHDQWSNILLTRCGVCGLKTRQLCPLPSQRPVPASYPKAQQPEVVELMTPTTMKTTTPSTKKKRKRKSEGGLLISEDLKQEIQMTMGLGETCSTKKKRKGYSSQVSNSKIATTVSATFYASGSEDIELHNGLDKISTPKFGPQESMSELKDSAHHKRSVSSKASGNESGRIKPIVAPHVGDTPQFKTAAKMDLKSPKQSPVSSNNGNLNSNVSPAARTLKGCAMATSPVLKSMKSDKVSRTDLDNTAQYGVPLLRINQVKKLGNVHKMQAKSNALKSAFKLSKPPPSTKSIKDFLNTLF